MKTQIVLFLVGLIFILQACEYGDTGYEGISSGEGSGGSMARFTIINDHLYSVDESNLKVFDISSVESPEYIQEEFIGFGVETIFPLGDKLFLGTSSGMYIYDVNTPQMPQQISYYEHVIACDPVVSDGEYAYVTLSNIRETCSRSINALQIIDLENIQSPKLLKQYEMVGPRGLAIKNDTLWVCDGGLKVLDASDKMNVVELYHFDQVSAYDVILDKNRALVIGETGFIQYKLENDTIRKLSEINVEL
jgi:hypothetical protein